MTFDPSRLSRPAVQQALANEAMNDPETDDMAWFAVASWSGRWRRMFEGKTVGSPRPKDDIFLRVVEVCEHLNAELHHDGCWILMLCSRDGWNHLIGGRSTYRQVRAIWVDHDADLQFVVYFDDFLKPSGLRAPIDAYTQACETAWQQYHEKIFKVLAPSPDQIVRPE